MREISILVGLELRNFFGINCFRYTKDPNEKKRTRGTVFAWVLLAVMACFYIGSLVFGLCSLGLGEIVPAYLAAVCSLIILFFGIFSAGQKIFGAKGIDLLVSMPVKTSTVVLARFCSLYLFDLIFSLTVMLPGMAVFAYLEHPGFSFYLFGVLGTLLLPAIPLVISVLFGTLVMALSSRVKKKSIVQTLLSLAVVLGVMAVSFGMEGLTANMTQEDFYHLATLVGNTIGKIYPPALWLGEGMIHSAVLPFLFFVLLSLVLPVLTVAVVSKFFEGIVSRLSAFATKRDFQIRKMESRALVKTLLFKERKRYFSSSLYVTNTILGPVFGAVLSVACAVMGVDTIGQNLPTFLDLHSLLPFAVSAIFCMMTTTCCSVSMEGKEIWISKSLPIPTKAWLDGKILWNLVLTAPFYAVSLIALTVALKPGILEFFWLCSVPISLIVFSAVFGITVNLKFYRFDWENEAEVVKQGLSTLLGGFAGVLTAFGCVLLLMAIPAAYHNLAKGGILLLLWSFTFLFYRSNNRKSICSL